MKVEHVPPGIRITLPPLSVNEVVGTCTLTLTEEEATELSNQLRFILWSMKEHPSSVWKRCMGCGENLDEGMEGSVHDNELCLLKAENRELRSRYSGPTTWGHAVGKINTMLREAYNAARDGQVAYVNLEKEIIVLPAEPFHKVLAAARRVSGAIDHFTKKESNEALGKLRIALNAFRCPRCGGDGRIRCPNNDCLICLEDNYCEKSSECPNGCPPTRSAIPTLRPKE